MTSALASHLAAGWRVTAFDRPGHGGSARPAVHGSLRAQVALLREGFERLGLQRPILVGHSVGAPLVATFALDHPGEIAGAVCLSPIVVPELELEQVLFGPRAVSRAARTAGEALDLMLNPLLWNAMFLPQQMRPVSLPRFRSSSL